MTNYNVYTNILKRKICIFVCNFRKSVTDDKLDTNFS